MNNKNSDIAVIGMAGRFPDADNVSQFWENICDGKESIRPLSDEALKKAGVTDSDINDSSYVKVASTLDDIDKFDAPFFKISPAEAQLIDPQLRLLLQCAWETLEDAGLATSEAQNIGLFAGAGGITTNYYSHFVNKNSHFEKITAGPTHLGNDKDFLATYISYKLNLTGPSVTVQTACSTSLVALHQACQSVRNNECDMAIAGGVTIRVPHVQGYFHKDGHIVSKSGHVRTFDEKADGAIFGNGLGLVLVKKLDDAIRDGDQIYAVIKGSAITNDGKAKMSYAASSARGQIRCITTALENAGVDAGDIGYVEAHGTGTYMGDPEEVKALSAAFKKQTDNKGFCALGAVKTNIGHLEAAAGITGFIKAALSVHHGYIPPTLHFNKANPRIKFEKTPFFVNNALQQWPDSDTPRTAAVNSLGVGGTNAFMVLSQYTPPLPIADKIVELPVIVPMSAKSEDGLQRFAQKLVDFISTISSKSPWAARNINLADLAYTLQVGREAMDHRVAFIVSDIDHLQLSLTAYIVSKAQLPGNIVQSSSQTNSDKVEFFKEDEDPQQVIAQCISDKQWHELAAIWIEGYDFDWRELYVGTKDKPSSSRPQCISLPTYAFAKEPHWIETGHLQVKPIELHPLLHVNTSDLSNQGYSSNFSGDEFFLRDHQVKFDQNHTQKVLPGVAYMEMIRAAIQRASSYQLDTSTLILYDVVWLKPIVVTEPKDVSIALFAQEQSNDKDDKIDYEIYTHFTDDEGQYQEVLHCQGQAAIIDSVVVDKVDIEQLKEQMQHQQFDSDTIYPALKQMGLDYGPAFKGIRTIFHGEHQLLAELDLPLAVESSLNDFVLHPSLLDSALQSTNALVVDMNNPPQHPLLPFALESIEIVRPCSRKMFAWARFSPGHTRQDKLIKLDIDMFDASGNVCVQAKGFTARMLGKQSSEASEAQSLFATPVWQPSPVLLTNKAEQNNKHDTVQQHIILCDMSNVDGKQLQSLITDSHCQEWQSDSQKSIAQNYSALALSSFSTIKVLMQSKPQSKVLVQIVIADGLEQSLFSGLSGMLKSAALENPQLCGQVIITQGLITSANLAAQLAENVTAMHDSVIKYEQGIREVLDWQEIPQSLDNPPKFTSVNSVFKDQGVYLITGGLGGLGVLFGKEILSQTSKARIILTGRAPLSGIKPEQQDRLADLQALGQVDYQQLDLADEQQVTKLVADIEKNHQLNGIIHSAGMIEDNFILKKSADEFARILTPKVVGTYNLDIASHDCDLDFMVLFSSLTSAIGNIGQADYGAANGFMDMFVGYRNQLIEAGLRRGQTLAINWSLWEEGGMGQDQAAKDILRQTTGIAPMKTATGMHAFYRSLALQLGRSVVMEGDLLQIQRTLEADEPKHEDISLSPVEQSYIEGLVEKTEEYLCKQLSGLLKMPAHKIDPQAPMEQYGIDSILAIDLTNQLEKTFGGLSKTLFFEYQSIRELTDYFFKAHSAQLASLFSSKETPAAKSKVTTVDSKVQSSSERIGSKRFCRRRYANSAAAGGAARAIGSSAQSNEAIAIIGLSGRYPQADNVQSYWQNLRDGKDCIVEVPADRWDWRDYYSEDRTLEGHHFSKWGGFINNVDKFDARFFNISPREAHTIDPQERLFLQQAWNAVEDAGYTRARLQIPNDKDLPGQVGVYVGVMYGEYQLLGAEASLGGQRMGFSSNLASIANRVSYVMNLHGPSLTLDTMCSSSLTSIHLACQDLRLGQTSLAIAGGVNVSIHPNKYLMLSAGQFISSDGHCQSFGEGGGGYIPAEGVGAVVLKRLSEAKRDGDHIYGIIRSSALSHGGKTNGYTVPNPQAQSSAITAALAEAKVDPRHISYIEAHGTGTKLGDPIEIAALNKAFYPDGKEKEFGYCDLGSAKSNIGHCESAAGIAGLTKVLLQMQHRQIVPSLHSAKLNPHIDFANSPFVVNQTLKDWEPVEINGRQLPRIAGISSFGAGGANAHLIIEEYPQPPAVIHANTAVIIPLSARTQEQLQQKASDLLDFIRQPGSPALKSLDLVDMAHTLQVGREGMNERLGFIVSSLQQLVQKLEAYVDGEQHIEDYYRGQAKVNRETLSLFGSDADFAEAMDKWIAAGKLSKLTDLWVKGFELDWQKFYQDSSPRFVSLPGYPFANDRFWIDVDKTKQPIAHQHGLPGFLHPLLQVNTSSLSEQRFSSTFTGSESFIAERLIKGQTILPAVAYLEMVRAALQNASDTPIDGRIVQISDLTSASPMTINTTALTTDISLLVSDGDAIDFEIYTDEVVHCQGTASVLEPTHSAIPLDLDDILSRTTEGTLSAELCYQSFKKYGVDFGPNFQAIVGVQVGKNQLLAQLVLPSNVLETQDQFGLHPIMVDAAIQSAIALALHCEPHDTARMALQLALPFSMASAKIFCGSSNEMFAWVRYSANQKLDIDLCDSQGNICLSMTGLAFDCQLSDAKNDTVRRAAWLQKDWLAAPLANVAGAPGNVIIIHHKSAKALAQSLANQCIEAQLIDQSKISQTNIEPLLAGCEALIDLTGTTSTVQSLSQWMPLVQQLVELKRAEGFSLTLVTQGLESFKNNDVQLAGAEKAGLYRMLQSEYPNVISRHVDLDHLPLDIEQQTAQILQEVGARSPAVEVCYRNTQRYVSVLKEIELNNHKAKSHSEPQVLLVTGGTRGLGLACAKHMVEHHGYKKLVLTGREVLPEQSQWHDISAFGDSTQQKIKDIQALQALGAQVLTLSFPLDDNKTLKQQYAAISKTLGPISGIIHAAGLTDSENPAFIRKSAGSISRVLSPKVEGVQNLLSLVDAKPLDFVVLFSSVAAIIPSLGAGQSDYVMANAYMDYYAGAHYKTLPIISLQWPSWKETGMGEVKNKTYLDTGLRSITTQEGLAMLDQLLAADLSHPVVMPLSVDSEKFNVKTLMQLVKPKVVVRKVAVAKKDQQASISIKVDKNQIQLLVQQWLQTIVEDELKMDAQEVDVDTDLADYGIDSVLLVQMLGKINKGLEVEVDPSIFLEYPTVAGLSSYLQVTHNKAVAKRFDMQSHQSEPQAQVAQVTETLETVTQTAPLLAKQQLKRKRSANRLGVASQVSNETIAVVGMSCRFAGAENLEQYWQMLSTGRSAIAAIPANCWGFENQHFGALLDNIYGFDSGFFMIPPEDAQVMDPQALVLLEESLKTIYHSGYTNEQLSGQNVGVYVGARSQSQPDAKALETARNPILAVGQNYLAANLSQYFNLSGPALVIDTACSSAIVGMNMAVDAMRSGSIDGALVGGVSLLTSSLAHDVFASRNLQAKNGEFHIFDDRASGVVIGEGCGMVYLKPLSAAKRDGDTIYAQIAGVSVNNDGRTAGPASPNIEAQKAVMHSALKQSGCRVDEVSYLEINGSGSQITDLLEAKAIAANYRRNDGKNEKTPLYLGSMKPNIGHPLCAEGIASFIKVALMLHHQSLVPFLSGQQGLRHFSIEDAGFAFPRQATPAVMEYAAMNCFADGGTNAHVVLQVGEKKGKAPLSVPSLNRVDVRTNEPLIEASPTLRHTFSQSKAWRNQLTIDHPVLANHKVYDQALLPGLAWIDLLYQWFEEAGHEVKNLQLNNLSIYRPLTVSADNPVNLSITAKVLTSECWDIEVSGTDSATYITAQMKRGEPTRFSDIVDVAQIPQQAKTQKDLADIYQTYRGRELVHADMMLGEGQVYVTDDATWVHVKVNEDSQASAANFRFHPTLIDGSAIGTYDLFTQDAGLFLPMFYESFSASDTLTGECYMRVKHDSVAQNEELQTFTLEFFSLEGRKIAELKNFKNKRVRDGALNTEQGEQVSGTVSEPIALVSHSFDSMSGLLQSVIAAQLGVQSNEIATDRGYYELGLESVGLLKVVKSIETLLATTLSPILMFEYTNIDALANHLAQSHHLPDAPNKVESKVKAKAKSNAKNNRSYQSASLSTHAPLNVASHKPGSAPTTMDIAVIGMSGRYPQASNLDTFWQNLKDGKDCVTEVPKDRWDFNSLSGIKSPTGKEMSKWGGFIDNVDCFDPLFFNVSPKETETLDPQERVFLEVCWETLENAGYTPKNLVTAQADGSRPVGVFVGVMHKDYSLIQAQAVSEGQQIPVSLNNSAIANRMSYFCDFNGPSMTIDTACSSSLTAVHLAMQSVIKNECEVAFAGGVNLSLHPDKYQSYGLLGMHSSDGRCNTFGEGGDGYVSAEGVGAVLLKPLAKALEDGDNIYAVLKGSSVNHVGKVSGITVPSPVAQGNMIADCFNKTGIDPESISYIEAHGTGTSLGDPIEIQGLNRAFAALTDKKQFCALGSVKSNLGHAEAAAGISGLTKTILQLHHKTLVKSLHSEVVNPYLDLPASPFYVQSKTEPWLTTGQQPRRAGISSFGATGSNVHVIVEEFVGQQMPVQTTDDTGVLLPLSAKNPARLKEYAQRLTTFLQANEQTDLHSLAYTLQTGRINLEERLVVMATSIADATNKLAQWCEGNSSGGLWQEKVQLKGGITGFFDSDEDLQQATQALFAKGKLSKLAQLWVKGMSLDWSCLYESEKPQRISLPAYPFAKERYWVQTNAMKNGGGASPWLYPLLHTNTSDLTQQQFSSTFTGHEFYIEDHLIAGKKVLPGVAYLEMAVNAIEQATPPAQRLTTLELYNTVWVQPLVINQSEEVSIGLIATDGQNVSYEINCQSKLHCQGQALFSAKGAPAPLDILQLHAQMQLGRLDLAQMYAGYHQMAIHHGPALQGIKSIYRGQGQLLAELAPPTSVANQATDFMLHPSLMDSAFQATLALNADMDNLPKEPLLPFALDSLMVYAPCNQALFAWVRYAPTNTSNNGGNAQVVKFDIDLCDPQGNICAQIEGLSSRMATPKQDKNPLGELHSFVPTWHPVTHEVSGKVALSSSSNILLLSGDQAHFDWLKTAYPNAQQLILAKEVEQIHEQLQAVDFDHLMWIAPDVDSSQTGTLIEQQSQGVLEVFCIIKALFKTNFAFNPLQWTLITANTQNVKDDTLINATHSSVAGLIGSLVKEYPHWQTRLLDVDSLHSVDATQCLSLALDSQGDVLAHRDSEWFKQQLMQLQNQPQEQSLYRKEGVYVVIGGAGGLGEVWSRYMAEHHQAQMVWIGRQALNDTIANKIDAVAAFGPAPLYIEANATDADSLAQARDTVLETYPNIHAVIHCAIVLQDQSITNMAQSKFVAGLSAKVDISVNMDKVFGADKLDFMLFFSSINAFIKGAGQCNYAAGCTFKDSFAHQLNRQHNYPVKIVNWGFWGNVGIVADEVNSKRMAKIGLGSIEVDEGMAALNSLMSAQPAQIAVIKTFANQDIANLKVSETLANYPPAQAVLPAVQKALPKVLAKKQLAKKQIAALAVEMPGSDILNLADKILMASLRSLGLFAQGRSTIADLSLDKQPAAFYERWLSYSIDYLQRQEMISADIEPLDELFNQWDSNKTKWAVNATLTAQINLVEACLRALPKILSGQQRATDVMFPNSSMHMVEGIYKNNALADFYNDILGQTLVACIKQQLKVDKNARIRLLEIGAGTGGTTAKLLPMLQPFADSIDEYCYTDLSKAFLMHAQEHYQPQFPALTTAIFNATQPLANQAIEPNQYDYVIATNVLHATPNIRETIANAKAVLKTQGVLLLNEISNWKLFNHLTFGLLEGWWLYEDSALRLPGNPGLTPDKWTVALKDEGYESIYYPAQKAHDLGQQVIAAASNGQVRQAIEQVKPTPTAVAKVSAPVVNVVKRPVRQVPLATAAQPSRAVVGVTDQMIEDHVSDILQHCIADSIQMNPQAIESNRSFVEYGVDSIIAVQLINQINQKLQLVLQTTVLFDYESLEQLAKFIIGEHQQVIRQTLQKVSVEVQPALVSMPATTVRPDTARQSVAVTGQMIEDHVRDILQASIADSIKMDAASVEADRGFAEYGVDSIIAVQLINQINQKLNIVLQTTVLFDYATLDELTAFVVQTHLSTIENALTKSQPQSVNPISVAAPRKTTRVIEQNIEQNIEQVQQTTLPLQQGDSTYQRVLIEGPGEIQNMQIVQAPLPVAGPNQVCVALKAFSLNFGDLLCVRGMYPTMPPYPFTPGYDGSGVVVAVGQGVQKVKVGDSVIVEAGEALGAHATAMICEQQNVTIKPDFMSHQQACALPVVSITMIDAFAKANIQPGESILIQTAAGGTGLVAVQLAKHYGAVIYATAGAEHKLEYLNELGVEHTINYLENDFEIEIKRLTGGRGVDVVINTLAGDAIQKGMNCLASGGRYIEIAMTALKSAKSIDLSILSNNQSFHSIDMRRFALEDPKTTARYRQEMLSLYQQGVLRPTICQTFSFEDIKAAYQALSDRDNIGKIVVSVPESLQIEVAATHSGAISKNDDIAIIGMSGRFAESESLDAFWQNIKQGKDLVKQVTRWAPKDSKGGSTENYCSKGSFVESIDRFDPLFFKISPLEAQHMDPQQRVFLEESWTALEDAGYAGSAMDEKECGIYVGCIEGQYDDLFGDDSPGQSFWGNACSVIPARIAYYLNLRGPAVAVDTACSSSMVSIHLACQSLWTQETEMALAGGVFLQSTAKFYQSCNRAGMLSPNGKCHTFDARADGFVPGEGAGVVVLKRLADALRDNDTIHGVIVGSGLNQDGSTNGITAPSSLSQERLERSVYDRFNINPRSIGVVEAHGTGTSLGDPIEFGALTRSFNHYTDDKQFCAVGSVKTNIGHAVTSAGVASVLKVLLALKHQQIPPSLHFVNANPVIDFANSPFYVNTQLRAWDTEPQQPRRGAVSSFGFSGTNAHMVIEQSPVIERAAIVSPGYLVVLSALSDEQLQQQVSQLLAHAKSNMDMSLNNLSYTLFVGRAHLTHRWGCIVRDHDELVKYLEQWLTTGKVRQVYCSQITESDVREQVSLKRYANQCIDECAGSVNPVQYLEHLATVADLYVQGYSLNFARLFGKDSARISLPTYPFAKERYWFDEPPKTKAEQAVLHPLLHNNTSDLSQQRYRSTFTGNESFLQDHQVNINKDLPTQKVLPAVAYLEMARAAVQQAMPELSQVGTLEIHNTLWAHPVVVEKNQHVAISLMEAGSGRDDAIDFEISSDDNINCQGQVIFSTGSAPASIDIEQLKGQMNEGLWPADELYRVFSQLGLEYGPSHQGISALYQGEQQVLAALELASVDQNYVLHPGMMDSALQATIGLIVDLHQPPAQPSLPFAVDIVRVYASCTAQMYAWARFAPDSQIKNQTLKLDIDLCDAQGNVCVQIQGFSTRALDATSEQGSDTFDETYYQSVIERVMNNEISVDQAGELE